MSGTTQTAYDVWWLERTDDDGAQRYPVYIEVGSGHVDDTRRYVPERTCRFELDETEGERRCSSCGEFVTQHSVDMEYFVTELTAEAFTHCPFCGAKVVDE